MLYHTLWIHYFVFVSTTLAERAPWSEWYNTDIPADGDKEQVLTTIRQIVGTRVCSCGSVFIQCRMFSTITLFNGTQHLSDNFLSIPCNKSGVICLFRGDRTGTKCGDYEIRYRCKGTDRRSSSISSRAEFIAVIACLSVIVPILGATAFQFVRGRRRLRQQQMIYLNPNTSDQPPSYDDVCFDGTTTNRNVAAFRPDEETLTPEVESTSAVGTAITDGSSQLELEQGIRRNNSPGNSELRQTVNNGEDYSRSMNTQLVSRIFVVNVSSDQTYFNRSVPEPPPSYGEAVKMIKPHSVVE